MSKALPKATSDQMSKVFMGIKDFHLKQKEHWGGAKIDDGNNKDYNPFADSEHSTNNGVASEKALKLKRLIMGGGGRKKKEAAPVATASMGKKPSWMMPAVSHGYRSVGSYRSPGGYYESDCDFVVAQREQIEEIELWFFGVFDARVGDGVTKYMQSHLFDKNPKESQIRGKSKDTMKKAYLGARAKIREGSGEANNVGSVSVMVIGGERLVLANMGDYRAVVCRDGLAHQIGTKNKQSSPRRHWSQRFFKGNVPSMRQSKISDLLVGGEKVDADTEFVILASSGIWEVMKYQEAVNLIRHIENPQAASERLANEASNRMSRGSISCLVIRFD